MQLDPCRKYLSGAFPRKRLCHAVRRRDERMSVPVKRQFRVKSIHGSPISKKSGHRWRWARRLIDLGDALIGRDKPGDLERARETYQQSLDMFSEMGAPGYVEVLEERLEDPA